MSSDTHINCASGGIFFSLYTQRFLFLLRGDTSFSNKWGIVGGKRDRGESDLDTILREAKEELGFLPYIRSIEEIDIYKSDDQKFQYTTYFVSVTDEFKPILNREHYGYCWVKYACWPRPLHPGLMKTLYKPEVKSFLVAKSN
jgi:8-oxo-dGTP pyrophosphatase MutT (NUDIX family)